MNIVTQIILQHKIAGSKHSTRHTRVVTVPCITPLPKPFQNVSIGTNMLFRTVHHLLKERYDLVFTFDRLLYLRHVHSCTKRVRCAYFSVPYKFSTVCFNIFFFYFKKKLKDNDIHRKKPQVLQFLRKKKHFHGENPITGSPARLHCYLIFFF